jgi:hypothetical protein
VGAYQVPSACAHVIEKDDGAYWDFEHLVGFFKMRCLSGPAITRFNLNLPLLCAAIFLASSRVLKLAVVAEITCEFGIGTIVASAS